MSKAYMWLLAMASFVLFVAPMAGGDPLPPQAESLIDAAMAAYEAQLADMGRGFGEATVVTSVGPTGKPSLEERSRVQFWYLNDKRRSDFFKMDEEGTTLTRIRSEADDGEQRFSYDPASDKAYIRALSPRAHRSQWGSDFHPSTFLDSSTHLPVMGMLRRLKDAQGTNHYKVDVEDAANGLIRLVVNRVNDRDSQGQKVTEKVRAIIIFDPAHAYRVTSCQSETSNVNGPGSLDTSSTEIEWYDNSPGINYPKSIKYEARSVMSSVQFKNGPPDGMSASEWQDFRERQASLRITVNEFRPGGDIGEKMFTLEGMGIGPNTSVSDQARRQRSRQGESGAATIDSEPR